MPDKTLTYIQLAQDTARQITSNYRSWTAYLSTASRLYKYQYSDQLLIHAQRPNATACAEYDLWNNTMHRYVRRGSKGIALLHNNAGQLSLCYARETILKIKHIISPAFDCAVEDELIGKNPVQSKRLLINTDKGDHHKAIPPELMQHVRKHMDTLPRRERCIVALLCYTGLRFEEILGLRWNDIDLEAKEIQIQRAVIHPTRNQPLVKLPKTKASTRTIPLADKLIDHLSPFESEGFILGGEKPLTYQQKKRSFDKIRERMGLEAYSAHDFRHTCATEWKEHGMSLQEVSKLLGHTNTSVTERCYVEFRKHGMNKARMVMNMI